jgi:DNA-directed RNA polymerase
MLDAQTLTAERFTRNTERTAREMGWGDTDAGLAIATKYLDDVTALVVEAKRILKPREHRDLILKLPDNLVALVGLASMVSAVTQGTPLPRMCLDMGVALENECYGDGLKTWDADRADKLIQRATTGHRRFSYRRTALRSLAQAAGYKWEKWTSREQAYAGRWLVEVMLASPVLELDANGFPALTETAMEHAMDIVAMLHERHPLLLPVASQPEPWDAAERMIDGYRVNLVRTRDKLVKKAIKAAIRDGRMDTSLEALNAAQSVPYRINGAILEVAKWAYENNVSISGLPPKGDIEIPKAPEGVIPCSYGPPTRQWLGHMEALRGIRQLNRSYIGERLQFHADVVTAEHLTGGPFWTHLNWDYRGRVYGIPRFNFQRQDYVRAMFEFEQGQLLDERGVYWLKVHLANCGDFGKISKRPFDERAKWTDDNEKDVWNYAKQPKQFTGWAQADKPFLFLAACMAYRDHVMSLDLCHLPLAFDGSCSGLQHLGAMTRDDQTCRLVNLTHNEEPNDVYAVVAEVARRKVEDARSVSETSATAQACLNYGIDRKLVKRNVMTFSYSSKAFGMSEQHMEDTMVPLKYEVFSGKRKVHPFGADGGLVASRFLAKHTYDAIKETVRRPADAMAFLQNIARALSHEGLCTSWHTPLGFPVVMRYANTTSSQVNLLLHDKGVPIRVQPTMVSEAPGIDKRRATSAIAPSFVHSLDACHLMMAALAAKDEGITSMAFVHDSFGCLPNDADKFRPLIRETFRDLYERNDVLFDILREAAGHLDTNWYRLPDMPDKGDYEMNEVMGAEYAFA